MRIVVTGAAGRIGREVLDELSSDHEVRPIDRVRVAVHGAVMADLARRPGRWRRRWDRAFEGAAAVVHLAADPSPAASWDDVLRDNVRATWNVLEAAAGLGVPRLVFASSHRAVLGLQQRLAPACFTPDGPKIGSDAAPRPLSPYGLSKAMGETAGRMLVDAGRLRTFVAVRIGSFRQRPEPTPEDRARWLAPADLRSLVRRCIEAELEGFHVVYGVSGQATSPFDLGETCRLLSWRPALRA